jgi:biotin carboxyl carrier protein
MRIVLELDGRSVTVDVDLERSTVTIGAATYPFKIVGPPGDRVEIEIGGEPATVDDWPEGAPHPGRRFSVNGEIFRAAVTSRTDGAPGPVTAISPPPARTVAPPAAAAPTAPTGAGTAIRPPMPGKLLEVRVTEGQTVAAGEVLVVLEAMKMRNELTAPIAGRIEGLAAKAGETVRPAEVLLRIVPV